MILGAEAADTVRAAAKRRMKSWNREAILDLGGFSIVEKKHMENGERRRERFDDPKRRKLSLGKKDVDYYYGFSELLLLLQTRHDGWKRPRPIPCAVQYEANSRFSLLLHTSAPNVHDAQCHLTPTQTRGQDSILVLSSPSQA